MATKYHYSHRTSHSHRLLIATLVGTAVILLAIAGLIYADLSSNSYGQANGQATLIEQAGIDRSEDITFDQPTYTVNLPSDWKEIKRTSTVTENSVTFQSGKEGADNRFLKIYTDLMPVNYPLIRMLPVSSSGDGIDYGELSDDCAKFTDTTQKVAGKNATAKWQGVNFTCGSPASILPETGTGTTADDGKLVVTGEKSGAHSYFFLYTDQNIQSDYSILYDAIESFQAK